MQPANCAMVRPWSWRKMLGLGLGAALLIAFPIVLATILVRSEKPPFLVVRADQTGNINDLTVNVDSLPPDIASVLRAPKFTTELSRDQIRELAIQHQLFAIHPVNPQLCFIEGDVTFWQKQRRAGWELELEFLARRLLLETADRAHIKIATQGILSYYSRQLYNKLAELRR
jgi:hypothetical protein